MNQWLPLVVGYGSIAVVIAVIAAFPNAWWSQELRRAYEVQRSGPLGRFTARDHLRSAGASVGLALALVALSFGAYSLAFRFRSDTRPGVTGEVYGFTLFLLGAVAVAAGIQSAMRGVRWYIAERKELRLAAAHPAEYQAVCEILRRYDAAQIAEFDEPVEFEFQAKRLLSLVKRAHTYEELVLVAHYQFTAWFGLRAGPRHRYDPMCHELWHTWQGRSSGT